MSKFLFFLATLFMTTSLFAQLKVDKWNISGEISLPSGRANPAFRNYLNGLVNIHPRLAYKPLKNWYVALGPRYMYYTIAEFKVPQKINGGMHQFGGDIEWGWSKWQSPNFGIEFGVKVGVSQQVFVTDLTRISGIQKVTSMYTEPAFAIILLADEAIAYRWTLGYLISGYDLKPWQLGFNTMGGYTAADLNKPCQSLMVGFGITYYLGNTRSDVYIDDNFE
jgi:hypothetical protein